MNQLEEIIELLFLITIFVAYIWKKKNLSEEISKGNPNYKGSLMEKYIKYVSDRLLGELGYAKIYKETNPFPFMENISLEGKTNFFEQRVSQYKKADYSDSSFNISDDF